MRFFLLFLLPAVFGSIRFRVPRDPVTYSTSTLGTAAEGSPYKWAEEWLESVPIDHFSFADKRNFRLRYKPGGPIFFYTGNEGSLESFATNTGFMWDIAPQFQAAVVFAEHRFYGKTQPFGNKSYEHVNNLGYLSAEQALADFAILLTNLTQGRIPGAQNSLVVVFGGSYGGMLAAWFRIKYPHIAIGAIAASAPVFQFAGTSVANNEYAKIVTRTFTAAGCKPANFVAAWGAIRNLSHTAEGRHFLNQLFKLDIKSLMFESGDAEWLIGFVDGAVQTLPMVDYPYPSNFLAPLPAWPVKVACSFLNETLSSEQDLATALYRVANLYYNYTGQLEHMCANPSFCSDGAFSALGDTLGWNWQSCTEMVMPMCTTGPPDDFYWKACPAMVDLADGCFRQFESRGYDVDFFRPTWILEHFGRRFPTASNIVFSNGYLDPWSGGGWSLVNKTERSLISLIIPDGAHHYDLRGADPRDTDAVKWARQIEIENINKWIGTKGKKWNDKAKFKWQQALMQMRGKKHYKRTDRVLQRRMTRV